MTVDAIEVGEFDRRLRDGTGMLETLPLRGKLDLDVRLDAGDELVG